MRTVSTVVTVVLLLGGVAYADLRGEVVSYHGEVSAGEEIGIAPADGFVLTDLVVGTGETIHWHIHENGVRKVFVETGDLPGAPVRSYHFNSGIPFTGGSSITVVLTGPTQVLTLSGYIPCPEPCGSVGVPAVSSLGMGMVGLLVIGAGGCVLMRRRASDRPGASSFGTVVICRPIGGFDPHRRQRNRL